MDHAYEASTVEMDDSGFEDLASQLSGRKNSSPVDGDVREKESPREANRQETRKSNSKRYTFTRGGEAIELDDDYEIEMTADKKPVRLTLRELKDRAAGDIAVKNRMHSLAEEKKRVQGTFREFANIARKDPLAALEFISEQAREADSEFEYQKYLEKLAEQAEMIGQMDENDRKAWEREKKLSKAEEDLSRKERVAEVIERKHQILDDYPEIGDSEFSDIVNAVLDSEELSYGLRDEHDVLDKAEDLIQEILTQRDLMSVISEINPAHVNDNRLIFALSDQLRQNPDLDEEDVRDIVAELVPKSKRRSSNTEKDRDIRTLSQKQRQVRAIDDIRDQHSSDYDLLTKQLMERKNEISKTPITMR